MKNKFITYLSFIIVFFGLFSFYFYPALAQEGGNSGTNSGEPEVIQFKLDNPIKADSLMELLELIVNGILYLAIPVIVIMVIYAGFLFVKARGNSKDIDQAKKVFFSVIIGATIILGAKLIIEIVQTTVNNLRG